MGCTHGSMAHQPKQQSLWTHQPIIVKDKFQWRAHHYAAVLNHNFPNCPEFRLMYANSKDSCLSEGDLGRMCNSLLANTRALHRPPVDPGVQYVSLDGGLSDFVASWQQAILEHSEKDKFAKEFAQRRSETTTNLTSFQAVGDADKLFANARCGNLSKFSQTVSRLPVFRAMLSTKQEVRESDPHMIYLRESALQASRILLCETLHRTGLQMWNTCWSQCAPLTKLMVTQGLGQAQREAEANALHTIARDLGYSVSVTSGDRDDLGIIPPEYDASDSSRLSEYGSEWLRLSACNLKDFSDANLFTWFLKGHILVNAEPPLVSAMLANDPAQTCSNAVAAFPDCGLEGNALARFQSSLSEWEVRLQRKQDRSQCSQQDFAAEVISCCCESADLAASILDESDAFKPDNPFGRNLCKLAFTMAVHLMVEFKVDCDAGHVWTTFGEEVRRAVGGDMQQHLRETVGNLRENSTKVGQNSNKGLSTLSSIMADLSKVKQMLSDVEGTNGKIGVLANGIVRRIEVLEPLKDVLSFNMTRGPVANEIFLGGFGDVDFEALGKDHFDRPFQVKVRRQARTVAPSDWCLVFDEMKSERPLVAVLVRDSTITSDEPQEHELSFLKALKNHLPSLGLIIWIAGGAINEDAFKTKAGGIEMRVITKVMWKPKGADFKDKVSKVNALNDWHTAATNSVTWRLQNAEKKFKTNLEHVQLGLREFLEVQSATGNLQAGEFYQYLQDLSDGDTLDERLQSEDFSVDFRKFQFPNEAMFGLNPFTSSIVQHHGDEKCVEVNELQIRTFLKDILRTQIMERGKYLGRAYYRHIVSSILMDVIGAKFALTPDSMLDLLRKFASRTPAKDPLFHTANFLLEENFVTMYVGGTVLSCTQLLDSMVGSMLLKNYPQTREVSLHQYITNLEAIAPFFAKSGPSDTFCLALPRKSPLPPSSRDKTERMKARLSHVEEIVGDIFQKGNSSLGSW